jgi:hypothetical protein
MKSGIRNAVMVLVVAALFSGCSVKYTIKDPDVSNVKYDKAPVKPFVLKVIDKRSNKEFHQKIAALSGLSVTLEKMDDPITWLSQSLEKEFIARKIPVKVVGQNDKSPANIVLTINKYDIVSRRLNAYTPWEAFHSFRGEVASGSKTCDIRAYFFNGKVPVWSISEVEDPCFNIPMSLMVKEIASKINTCAINASTGDATVNAIKARAEEEAKKKDIDACFPLFELGGTNNPSAMKPLIAFADYGDRIVRGCALSAIGMLGPGSQFDFLKKKYDTYEEIDKYMALKSIGDIGTTEARDFVKKAKSNPLYNKEYGFRYCADLYAEK